MDTFCGPFLSVLTVFDCTCPPKCKGEMVSLSHTHTPEDDLELTREFWDQLSVCSSNSRSCCSSSSSSGSNTVRRVEVGTAVVMLLVSLAAAAAAAAE